MTTDECTRILEEMTKDLKSKKRQAVMNAVSATIASSLIIIPTSYYVGKQLGHFIYGWLCFVVLGYLSNISYNTRYNTRKNV